MRNPLCEARMLLNGVVFKDAVTTPTSSFGPRKSTKSVSSGRGAGGIFAAAAQ